MTRQYVGNIKGPPGEAGPEGPRGPEGPPGDAISPELVGEAIGEYLNENQLDMVSPTELENTMLMHKAEPTPHKAYDIDLPRFDLIFENGLI